MTQQETYWCEECEAHHLGTHPSTWQQSNEEDNFERWWAEQSLRSFREAYGPDEPYRDGWGIGFKRSMREAWMARAALSIEKSS